jgi:hypothetical protein
VQEYRKAMADAPRGVPEASTVDAIWKLLQPARPGLNVTVLCSSVARRLPDVEREAAETTVKQALVVALDAAVRAGRDRDLFYFNSVFEALAQRWSLTYRNACPARRSHDMLEGTLKAAQRDLVVRGIDRDALWRVVRDGIPGLYSTRLVGGRGHIRGRSVSLKRRDTLWSEYHRLLLGDRSYRRPPQRKRLLLAQQPTAPLRIAQKVAGERAHDVIPVGPQMKQIIDILEGTRLLLHVEEVRDRAAKLTATVRAHPWRSHYRAWVAAQPSNRGQEFQKVRTSFVREHRPLLAGYRSLVGRKNQIVALRRHVSRARRHWRYIDGTPYLEVKTAYYKGTNGRLYARHIWPTEFSSKADPELEVILPAEAGGSITVENGRTWVEQPHSAIHLKTSARGALFFVRPSTVELGPGFLDEWAGEVRPLIGIDTSGSMMQIMTVVLGWRDEERAVAASSYKDGLVAGMKRTSTERVSVSSCRGMRRTSSFATRPASS